MRERGDEFRVAGINVQKEWLAVRHMQCLLADLAVSELPQPCRFRRFIPTSIYSCQSHNGTSDESTRRDLLMTSMKGPHRHYLGTM